MQGGKPAKVTASTCDDTGDTHLIIGAMVSTPKTIFKQPFMTGVNDGPPMTPAALDALLDKLFKADLLAMFTDQVKKYKTSSGKLDHPLDPDIYDTTIDVATMDMSALKEALKKLIPENDKLFNTLDTKRQTKFNGTMCLTYTLIVMAVAVFIGLVWYAFTVKVVMPEEDVIMSFIGFALGIIVLGAFFYCAGTI